MSPYKARLYAASWDKAAAADGNTSARRPLSTRRRPQRKYRYTVPLALLKEGRRRAHLRSLGLDDSAAATIAERYGDVWVILSGDGSLMVGHDDREKLIVLERPEVEALIVVLSDPRTWELKTKILRAGMIERGRVPMSDMDEIKSMITEMRQRR